MDWHRPRVASLLGCGVDLLAIETQPALVRKGWSMKGAEHVGEKGAEHVGEKGRGMLVRRGRGRLVCRGGACWREGGRAC